MDDCRWVRQLTVRAMVDLKAFGYFLTLAISFFLV